MTISFIHGGDPGWASFRYRAAWPARWLDATLNDWSADTVVLAKPTAVDAALAKGSIGRRLVVDFCDDHFDRDDYQTLATLASCVTCPTSAMATVIAARSGRARGGIQVVPDAYEFEEAVPHCAGNRLLWFGHSSNFYSLERVWPWLQPYPLMVMSDHRRAHLPWSLERLQIELDAADIVVLPATAPYKSPNRACEAIRRGCFVVAEPHRSLQSIPGIWLGSCLEEGIEYARMHPAWANERTRVAQTYVAAFFSPERCAAAWREAVMALARPMVH